jgi:Ni/Co efflux regulator RcnB
MKTTKRIAVAGLSALTLAAGFAGTASAQAYRGDWNRSNHNDRNDNWNRQWRRGERLPSGYARYYRQVDWRHEHLRAPPRGYHYVRDNRGETLLVGIATGAILGIILGNAFN